ncbi:hypothetical protein PInf_004406 [Phytophthora infestans]|nr:hypothetical protein PInf_004406 [Phytophthora infestans]
MAMKESTKTVYVVVPEANLQKKERRVCTVGDSLPEGAALIRKTRDLINYFNRPQTVDRLTKWTVVSFPAFRAYFQYCESSYDSQMFNKLTDNDWKLLVEMEVITSFLADLTRI